MEKLEEETRELKIAIEGNDIDNIAEETLDVIQVAVNILGTLFDNDEITKEVIKHNAKLKGRGHEVEKVIFEVRGNKDA